MMGRVAAAEQAEEPTMNVKVPAWITAPRPVLPPAGAADPSTPGAADGAADSGDTAGGPAGNARLTAATGMVLLVLLAIEG
jgi:hypothetical protein